MQTIETSAPEFDFYCEYCDAIVDPDDMICPNCGGDIAETIEADNNLDKCLNCGNGMAEGAEFCNYCGLNALRVPTQELLTNPSRRVGPPGYLCFVNTSFHDLKVRVHEEAEEESRTLLILGVAEPVPIVGERGEWYEVLLPGNTLGFVLKSSGEKYEIATGDVSTPLGYYRINTELSIGIGVFASKKLKSVDVYVFPDETSDAIVSLQPWHCVPIVHEADGWFKIQLDDGIRGFVPVEFGIRTLRRDSIPLPKAPDEKSRASLLGGLASFVGLLAVSTVIGAARQGMKDIE